MECQYCHETVIISELVLHTSKCTSLSELIDKYPDCLEHASTYGIGASLLAIPGKFRLIRIVRMMDILLHMHAFGLPRGSELRNQLEWNVKKEKLGLLVLMCAKQFNDRKLYKLLFRRFFCEYKEPKQCVIEDLHLILGNNINILHVGSLLENSGLRVEYDIDFCLSPISCGRLYCNHNKISNIEFVKDYGGFLQLRHVVRDESMQLISKDVSGIIMEYSFAAQVVVNSY